MPAGAEHGAARILVIDDDRDVGEVVTAILSDEGYEVTTLEQISDETVRAAIGRLEPDCILLDGVEAAEYAEAWATAAELSHRSRPIPTVMFTAHSMDATEALEASSERAAEAGFFAVLRKPFHLDELVATVGRAVAEAVSFNHSERAEHARTEELVAQLTAAGARDVQGQRQTGVGELSQRCRGRDAAVLVAGGGCVSRGALQQRRRSPRAGRSLLQPRRRDRGVGVRVGSANSTDHD